MSDNQSENEKDGGTRERDNVAMGDKTFTFVYVQPEDTEAERCQTATQPPRRRPRNDADSGLAGASGDSHRSDATVSAPSNAPSTQRSSPSRRSRRDPACERCHTRKERCDMSEGGSCKSCERNSVKCKPHRALKPDRTHTRSSCEKCRSLRVKCVNSQPGFACQQCSETSRQCSFGQAKPACNSCTALNVKCEKGPTGSCLSCINSDRVCSNAEVVTLDTPILSLYS